ncbi:MULTISPECIES: Cys-tRNA(Pro) deacylase [unclassified Agarivorans]|uniref:Cys-tRNA(Pro) deacylase n=1 Tax=unclassified Agarivorans TaxID=2636026 RepID=UPI0026E37387|nr:MULTISPECIES: Cys-tRNA(Pro) deacylase [unclassified Agarivorans]MDO6686539.1 Cys-tRNA(Pro) deacylase [Agarivorans sp. 3_MG-2023]MDO6715357.1 Cys-tRNA(Pro) deacylase [Agarivorans sp. 2_MG-2023]
MTPAVDQLKKAKQAFSLLEYKSDPQQANFGQDSAEKLGLAEELVFKTLVACDESDPKKMVVAVVPVTGQLDLKALAKAAKIKKMRMAEVPVAERTTGYVKGGISPFGQKKRLPTFVDSSAEQLAEIVVSAGKRGLSLQLSATVLQQLLGAQFATLSH